MEKPDFLADFLTQQCKERRMSLRSLSVNAGLSPGTVHNIVKKKYNPSISSLNALADYLGVRREHLWHMAGLLEGRNYSSEIFTFNDPKLELLCAQVNRLTKEKRDIVISVIEALIVNLKPDSPVRTRTVRVAKTSKD